MSEEHLINLQTHIHKGIKTSNEQTSAHSHFACFLPSLYFLTCTTSVPNPPLSQTQWHAGITLIPATQQKIVTRIRRQSLLR